MKKNLFLTFCFSLIPGAGQMYQEYMKRGISVMILFALTIAIAAMTGVPIFTIPIPIIYAYSFFDTFNIRNKIERNTKDEDDYIWQSFNINLLKDISFTKRNTVLGGILLLIGIYLLFNNIISEIAYQFDIQWLDLFVNNILRFLPAAIISVISIAIGVKLLFNKK